MDWFSVEAYRLYSSLVSLILITFFFMCIKVASFCKDYFIQIVINQVYPYF